MQYLLILNWCFTIVTAWNLATYDDAGLNFVTNNNDYEIVHVSVFYVRAFLTIRNSRNSSKREYTIHLQSRLLIHFEVFWNFNTSFLWRKILFRRYNNNRVNLA